MSSLEAIAIAIIGFIGGLLLIYYGFISFKHYQVIRDTPTEKIQSISVGTTEIKGTAKPSNENEIYKHPLTKDDVVYYDLEIEEHHYDDDGSDWEQVEHISKGEQFIVDDGTGQVGVFVMKPRFEFHDDNITQETFTISPESEPPDVLKQFQDNESSWVPNFLDKDKYRVTVKSIKAGEDVFVFGEAEIRDEIESPTNEDNVIITNPSMDRFEISQNDLNKANPNIFDNRGIPFIISTQNEDELQSDLKWSGPSGLIIGLLISSISLYFLASWFIV